MASPWGLTLGLCRTWGEVLPFQGGPAVLEVTDIYCIYCADWSPHQHDVSISPCGQIFIHSFNKHLLSTQYVQALSSVLETQQ